MKNKLGAMTNEKFIQCFFTDRLKKKRDFGNLYEVSGAHANLLMYNSSHYGSHIMGVKFKGSNLGFFNSDIHLSRANDLNGVAKLLQTEIDLYKIKIEPLAESGDITKIRLVDRYNSGNYKICLIEIEGVKLLIESGMSFNTSKLMKRDKFAESISKLPTDLKEAAKNFVIHKIGSKAGTITDARLHMIPEEALENDRSFFYGGLWFVPVADEESFLESNSRDMKLLATPPTRQQFGITDEYGGTDLIVQAIDDHGVPPEALVTPDMLKRIREFVEVEALHEGIEERQAKIKAIKVNKKLTFTSGIVEAGLFVDECEDIYAKGRMLDMEGIGYFEVLEGHNRYCQNNTDRLEMQVSCLPLLRQYKTKAGKDVTTLETWHKVIPMESIV